MSRTARPRAAGNGGDRPLSRRQQQAAETRQTIIRAAWSLFVQHGYTRTTMEAVAREAHVSVASVYLIFGTKQQHHRDGVENADRGQLQALHHEDPAERGRGVQDEAGVEHDRPQRLLAPAGELEE